MRAKLLDVDFLAGLAALAFAITALWVVELTQLADPKLAGGFAIMSLGRWVNRWRPRKVATPDKGPPPSQVDTEDDATPVEGVSDA